MADKEEKEVKKEEHAEEKKAPKERKNIGKLAGIIVAAIAAGSHGAEFHLKSGLTDIPTNWQTPASYDENEAPSAGDIVVIPNDTTAYVDDDTVAFVGSLKRLQTTGSVRSRVRFDISTNATVRCAMNAYSTNLGTGRIVKRGAGELTLKIAEADYPSTTGKNNYYLCLNVEEGALRFDE